MSKQSMLKENTLDQKKRDWIKQPNFAYNRLWH